MRNNRGSTYLGRPAPSAEHAKSRHQALDRGEDSRQGGKFNQ